MSIKAKYDKIRPDIKNLFFWKGRYKLKNLVAVLVASQSVIQKDQQPMWWIIFGFVILVVVLVFVFCHIFKRYKIKKQLPNLLEQTKNNFDNLKDSSLFSTRAQQYRDEADDNLRRAKIMYESPNTNFMEIYTLLNLINHNIADSNRSENNYQGNYQDGSIISDHLWNNGPGGFGGFGNGVNDPGLGRGGGGFAEGGGGRETGHHSYEIERSEIIQPTETHQNGGFGGFGNEDNNSGLNHGDGGFADGGGGRSDVNNDSFENDNNSGDTGGDTFDAGDAGSDCGGGGD